MSYAIPPPYPHYHDTPLIPSPPQNTRYPVPYRVPTNPTLTLLDLRAQIIANALTLLPSPNPTSDNLEVAVARFLPSSAPAPQAYKYYGMLVRRHPTITSGARGGTEIVVKGKPMESELAALEWLLRDSEERVHAFAQERSRESAGKGQGKEGECCVM